MAQVKGKVAQIIGPVVDVSFDTSVAPLPDIYDSLEISKDDGSQLVLEVQSHIGEDQVRTISMDSTDGLQRGADVVATGNPIQMPIGEAVNGRLFNVIGDAIDGIGNLLKRTINTPLIHSPKNAGRTLKKRKNQLKKEKRNGFSIFNIVVGKMI